MSDIAGRDQNYVTSLLALSSAGDGSLVAVYADPTTHRLLVDTAASIAIGASITSGTEGSVLFVGTGGVLAQDNDNFFWDNTNKALEIGDGTPTYTVSTNGAIFNTKTVPGYFLALQSQNLDSGTTSSTDYVLSADNGTDTTNYVDLGINSSTNADPAYTIMGISTAYLYNVSGDMALGTATSGKVIKLFTGGTLAANERIRISSTATSSTVPVMTSTTTSPLAFTTTPGASGTPNLQTLGTTLATSAHVIADFNSTDAHSGTLIFYKSGNSTIGSSTVVANNEELGKITFVGAQQTSTFSNQSLGASITAYVDGVVTSGASADMPGRIVFATSADGSGTPTDRLIIDSAGVFKPATNDGIALGTTALSFSDLFLASGGVINFNAGNVTLTHSAGILTQNAGELRITSANVGTNADSVPTLSSTSTLTNKTLTNPTINAATLNGDLQIDGTPNSDDTWNGRSTNTFNAGATIAQFDCVYLSSSSTWLLTDADAVGTAGSVPVMMAAEAGTNTNPLRVILPGTYVRNDAWNWTPGNPLYLDTATPGGMTATAPSGTADVVRIVAHAYTADVIFWNPSNEYIVIT